MSRSPKPRRNPEHVGLVLFCRDEAHRAGERLPVQRWEEDLRVVVTAVMAALPVSVAELDADRGVTALPGADGFLRGRLRVAR
jgi:hypothetical protein